MGTEENLNKNGGVMDTFVTINRNKDGWLSFSQRQKEIDERFPTWPWPELVKEFGFFDDVALAIHSEVQQFINEMKNTHTNEWKEWTITLMFRREQIKPPDDTYYRSANAWLNFAANITFRVMTIKICQIPGEYKDFVLLDTLDHLEKHAGHGINKYVDGKPSTLRRKLKKALVNSPLILR